MRILSVRWIVACAAIAAACGGSSDETATAVTGEEYLAKVQAFRDKHEADYRRDYVSIAGLHFLEPGVHAVGSGPGNDIVLSARVPPTIGRITVGDGFVRYEPEEGVTVLRRDQPATAPIVLKEPGSQPADEIVIGDVSLVVHLSGERLSLRVRDPGGEYATAFRGFTWFRVDPSYQVTGRFIRDPEPRKVTVVNTFNDLTEYTTEGVVEFDLHGRTLRLRPFTTRPGRLFFVFRDASGGEETYKTARFLYADLADDGTTVLDFNQAYNPPCAFNPYTTCPIPLPENALPVKVLAGEKAYPVEVALPGTKS
ncbi:MAG TPA: DUF1684 domain-containing protein [Vicinamibacterales bacterium]|nr:DUF1684 domain-containing protein [Vicinamibacterales bacterium]